MADKAYKGVVSATYEKDWKDRDTGDDIILYSFQIEGEKRYFRTGTETIPEINEGAYIRFTADGRSGNVDLKTVADLGEAPKSPPRSSGGSRASAKRTGGTGGGSRDTYWEDKAKRDIEVTEPRISYSAAQKNATELVCAALNHDLLSFGNTAKGKRLDMMVEFVAQVTEQLAAMQMAAPEIMASVMEDTND